MTETLLNLAFGNEVLPYFVAPNDIPGMILLSCKHNSISYCRSTDFASVAGRYDSGEWQSSLHLKFLRL